MLNTEFIAANQASSQRLMIVLHGLGDSVAGYRWWPEAMGLPWLNYLLVDAPDPYYGGFAWYDLGDPVSGIKRSRDLLFQLLDQLAGKGFPPGGIVFSGFSQGCLMSIEIGARYRHHLAGIVGISGYVYEAEKLVKELAPEAAGQRFLLTHGTQDPLIPIAQVRPQIEILRRGGLHIEWHEFVKGHTIAGEQEMSVVREFVEKCYE
ncbi:MAG: serine esterase [Verrucomicrobiota bacterium]|jgi:phospholipase/carboxylesterase